MCSIYFEHDKRNKNSSYYNCTYKGGLARDNEIEDYKLKIIKFIIISLFPAVRLYPGLYA